MTDRGLPIVDGAPACPFVAFADDREARSTSPDHRHRCFAEVRPAERALAHQEAYCLSSAFPVCPTFQDWARREAAAARSAADAAEPVGDPDADVPPARHDRPVRGPHRDWSAPPRWAAGPPPSGSLWEEANHDGADDERVSLDRPSAGEGRGRGDDRIQRWDDDGAEGDDDDDFDDDDFDDDDADDGDKDDAHDPVRALYGDEDPMERSARRRAERAERLGRHRAAIAAGDARPRNDPAREQARRRPSLDDEAPSWERPRRFEAYPQIKTRMSLPGVPRLALVAVAIVAAGVAVFFLPALLGVGGPDSGTAVSPSPSANGSPSTPPASLAPTPTPAPTPVIYVVKAGDTLSKIAASFGVTLQDILAANTDTITDANKIRIGDRLIIPSAPPSEFVDPNATGSLPPP